MDVVELAAGPLSDAWSILMNGGSGIALRLESGLPSDAIRPPAPKGIKFGLAPVPRLSRERAHGALHAFKDLYRTKFSPKAESERSAIRTAVRGASSDE